MKTINRTVVTITPKQPYVDWANSFHDGGPEFDSSEIQSTALLIPDRYDEFTYEKFIKQNYEEIFEFELEAWMTDRDIWPEERSYKMFTEWFDVRVSDMVIDLGTDDIEIEDY